MKLRFAEVGHNLAEADVNLVQSVPARGVRDNLVIDGDGDFFVRLADLALCAVGRNVQLPEKRCDNLLFLFCAGELAYVHKNNTL